MKKSNWYQAWKTDSSNVYYILRYICQICRMRVFSIFIIAFANGINAANVALFYKYAIGALEGANPYASLFVIVLIYLLLHLGNSMIHNYYHHVKFPEWDMKIRIALSKDLYQKYASLDLLATDNATFYDNYTRALKEADQRPVQVLYSFQYFLSNFCSAVGVLSVVATMDPVLILFSIVPVITSSLVNMKLSKERYHYEMLLTKDTRKTDYIKRVFTVPEYREEIRTNAYLPFFLKKYSASMERINQTTKAKMPPITWKSVFGSNLFSLLNYAAPAAYLGWSVLHQQRSVGEFSTLLIGTANLSTSIFYAVILFPQIVEHSMFIGNLREILEYQPETEDIEREAKKTEDTKIEGKEKEVTKREVKATGFTEMKSTKERKPVLKGKNHSIKIEQVSFRYPSNEKETLRNISMHIKPGEKIALVGRNGAGKSTLVKLLLRLYDPQEGRFCLDGTAYKELDVTSLREAIAVIYQDPPTFAFSIGENVLCKKPEDKEEEEKVWAALKASGLASKVDTLPEKLNTPLSKEFEENGVGLSGGESQKLAMARAICKDAEIMIMDEPSSSLDPLSEYEMYSRMFEMCRDKTVILISHRLYSTKMVDTIYFLEDGAIVEHGSHEELMKQNGKYASLYRIQAEQYR